LTELFVVIVVLAMSAAILLPAATLDKEKAQRGICLNNLRQLGLATRFYALAQLRGFGCGQHPPRTLIGVAARDSAISAAHLAAIPCA
jgi:type II secretory pathway pseudopilin PulG